MGILDEAIREHLDLKRAHGAEESELKGLESEAFGPADRPDAISAPDPAVSPGSSITTPAGEGDQLDKVFKHETAESAVPSAETVEETKIIPAPDSEAEAETTISPVQLGSEAEAEDKPEVDTSPAPEAAAPPERSTAEPSAPPGSVSYDEGGDDAGDLLEAERSHLSSYPTEHYDVDAAIAEEDEIDLLSESSLSDELDRALDGPPLEVSDPEITDEAEIEDEPVIVEEEETPSSEMERPEPNFDRGPESRDPQLGVEKTPGPEEEPEAEFEPEFESAPDEAEEAEQEAEGDSDFFDQDDVLEATPDFLEETPEHDRLWFEQKEPKDFDFGD